MYDVLLWSHSYLRYAVLGLGLGLFAAALHGARRERPEAWSHNGLHRAFLAALDTQLLLGLLLYFVFSPLSRDALGDMGAAMKIAPLRFFGLEHPLTMFIAIAVAHVGRVRSQRVAPERRARVVWIGQLCWLVLTLLAIPWPGLDVGRPLLR